MSGRRSRGDGSVFYDDARKHWVAVIDLGRDPDTGRRVRRKASARTQTAARDKLDEMRAERRKAGTVGRKDVTVGQVVTDYLAHPPASWRSPVTVQVNTAHADRLTAALGRVRVAQLTPRQVERFLAGMAAGGYASATIGATHGLLRAAIRRAQRDGKAARNAAELADVPGGARKDSRALNMPQVAALLAAAKDDPFWRAWVLVAVTCGLRPGEMTGLRWQDIDLPAGVLRVRHSVKAGQLAALKTERSRRTLALAAAAAAALRDHKRAQAAERLRLAGTWHDHDLVFPGPDGTPAERGRARRGFAALCEGAGLGTGWTPYATRHTFCSVLSHGGTDIEIIADAMGHANSATTRSVYRHVLPDRISAAASAFDQILPA